MHPEESFNFVGGDVALGDDHRFHEVEGNLFAVRCVKENFIDFFAHELGVVAECFGEVLRCRRFYRLVEVRRDDGGNPVGHFVLLRHVVLFDFADFRERLVEFATGEERFEVKEHFAACRMRNPLGDGLAIVCFHGLGFAYDDDLFRREHRHGIARFDDDIGDGGDVCVGGVQHLLGHRIGNPVAKSFSEEFLDSLVLAELVFADERYEHGLLSWIT